MESEDQTLIRRQPKWFRPVFYGCIAASILFAVSILLAPRVLRSQKKSDQVEAISNARQIVLALSEFEIEYGTFPNKQTAALLSKQNPDSGFDLSGTSSNALLRQLFAAGIIETEQIFYARTPGVGRPKSAIYPGYLLQSGENAFAYISGLSSAGNPGRSVLMAPIIPGTHRFDPEPFKGRAIIVRIDGSVGSYRIAEDGKVYDKGGTSSTRPPHLGRKAPRNPLPGIAPQPMTSPHSKSSSPTETSYSFAPSRLCGSIPLSKP